ncbi:hypothetical protein LY78DRAFT_428072 [Colletotrichum sublineola]|nr:hypothetical protein LY78DRAFT_428072 [Colletotrichum sublineola]
MVVKGGGGGRFSTRDPSSNPNASVPFLARSSSSRSSYHLHPTLSLPVWNTKGKEKGKEKEKEREKSQVTTRVCRNHLNHRA